MLVKELIAELQKCNPESEVNLAKNDEDGNYEWNEIDSVDAGFENMRGGNPEAVLVLLNAGNTTGF